MIPVADEGAGETVIILDRYPYDELEKYRLVRITNKKGHVVTALSPVEEALKVEVRIPTGEEVGEEAQRLIPRTPYRAPFNWKYARDLADRVTAWIDASERQAKVR